MTSTEILVGVFNSLSPSVLLYFTMLQIVLDQGMGGGGEGGEEGGVSGEDISKNLCQLVLTPAELD